MKYTIVSMKAMADLITAVNDKIEEGWKPIGGHQITKDRFHHADFSQTMIWEGKEMQKTLLDYTDESFSIKLLTESNLTHIGQSGQRFDLVAYNVTINTDTSLSFYKGDILTPVSIGSIKIIVVNVFPNKVITCQLHTNNEKEYMPKEYLNLRWTKKKTTYTEEDTGYVDENGFGIRSDKEKTGGCDENGNCS